MSWKTMSTTFERGDITVIVNKIIDREYDMVAAEIIVRRYLAIGDQRMPHDTQIWLDDIKQLVTLRDALSSYIEQTGLQEGEQQ